MLRAGIRALRPLHESRWCRNPYPAEASEVHIAAPKSIGKLVGEGDLQTTLSTFWALRDEDRALASVVTPVLHLCESQGALLEAADVLQKVVHPHKTLWQENVLSVALRLECASENIDGAMRIASFMRNAFGPLKKRSLSPLLSLLCRHKRRDAVAGLLAEALDASAASFVELDHDDMRALAAMFRDVHEPPTTLHWLLQKVSPYLTSLPQDVAESLVAWRQASCAAPLSTLPKPVSHGGRCDTCGAQLQGFPFTHAYKQQLLSDIEKMLAAHLSSKKSPSRAKRSFVMWKEYVKQNAQRFDILIDGANVGYYGLSNWYGAVKRELRAFRAAHYRDKLALLHAEEEWSDKCAFVDVPVSVELIDTALRAAQARGWRPLVLLHERHTEPHNLFPSAAEVVARWKRDGVLYTTPTGMNDDVCWLFAAVSVTTASDEACRESERRRMFVLTNDKMRDHHFQLLSKRPFVSWRDRHRVGFKCSRVDGLTNVVFEEPAPYTRCIQLDAVRATWHLPTQADEWLCLQ